MGKIFQLMDWKEGGPALHTIVLERFPQLRLPCEQHTNRIIQFSYQVLLDTLVILATKTPYDVTASDRSIVEMEAKLETYELALDQFHEQRAEAKEWLEAIDSQLGGSLGRSQEIGSQDGRVDIARHYDLPLDEGKGGRAPEDIVLPTHHFSAHFISSIQRTTPLQCFSSSSSVPGVLFCCVFRLCSSALIPQTPNSPVPSPSCSSAPHRCAPQLVTVVHCCFVLGQKRCIESQKTFSMRAISSLRSLCSNLNFRVSQTQISHLSDISNSSKLHRLQNAQEIANEQPETTRFDALFKDITEIFGANDLIPGDTLSEILKSGKAHGGEEDSKVNSACSQNVCTNVKENTLQRKENIMVLSKAQLGNLDEDDVSRVVGEITRIVRVENELASMEEKLDNLNYVMKQEIVEKVLKRCFKVPYLAMKFFEWVKLKDGFSYTTQIYNTMLNIAGEAKEFRLVEKLLQEMDNYSLNKDIRTWTILMSQYGKANRISEALLAFKNMKKSGCEPDATAYKAIISSLCTAGKGELALEFYKDTVDKDLVLDIGVYKMLMNCMARLGDIMAVRLVGNDMTRLSLLSENNVYGCVLKSFCNFGRIKEALELIRELKNKDFALEHEYFKTLVRGLCKADRITDALEMVEIMARKGNIDHEVHGIIINEYLLRNQVQKALDAFQSMKETGHAPPISTYTRLMQRLFRLNRYEEACKLYDEMLGRGMKLDIVAITAMVAGHVSNNCISEAWKLFKSMEYQGFKPTWKSYSVFIKELCKASKTDDIVKLLNEMMASKVVIGDEIFNWVMTYLEKKGELGVKEKVQQMYRASKLDPQTCDESGEQSSVKTKLSMDVIHHQQKPEKVDSSLVNPQVDIHTEQDVQGLSKILSSSMDWSLIKEKLEKSTIKFTPALVLKILNNCNIHGSNGLKFFSWVGKQVGYRHTTETYNMAIKIAGSGKDFKHMRSLFFEMRRNSYAITSDTWTIMIMLYGRTGLTQISVDCFQEMKASGYSPNGSTYKCLIIALCEKKGRKVDQAIKIYKEMISAGCVPDQELIQTYLGCLCEVGKISDARGCTDSLKKVGYTIPLSHALLIRALCRAGRVEEALKVANEVVKEKSTIDQLTCGSIVHGLLRMGRLEEAITKVDSMKEAGIRPTFHVYTSMMVHFFKEKQIGKAIEAFEEMRRSGYEPTLVTYSALIRGYMNVGKVTDAWNIFYRMKCKGPFPDFETYSMFLTCLCKVGRSEEGLKLVYEMLDSGIVPSTINFRTVFYGLNREGKQDLARVVLQKKWELIRKRKI
ncbi:putative pentatricopeptide repeat-containing protein At5g06400, mitochondrial [Neltuma alba]|uniref:putative pentatricopeptide repeat-containing protein At5g06400, mitochondrial n=1 Tax=Neltuma alba TaxID=207710 RepID=UPI0010A2D151|nr:putative pentatricopeptide repeat-containing protein At5g06400, mitochondrial [Prosopis alba]